MRAVAAVTLPSLAIASLLLLSCGIKGVPRPPIQATTGAQGHAEPDAGREPALDAGCCNAAN